MRRLLLATSLLLLALAAPALAAPAHEGAVSAASPVFAWEGTAYGFNLVGEPCNTDHSCEDALLRVGDGGNLTVKWKGTAPAGPAWLGVTIYKSDAQGAEGDEVADGGALADEGSLAAKVQPGFYIVRVAGLLTSTATYAATATLKASTPPAATPQQPPASEPQQPGSKPKPKSSPKKKCKGKKGKARKRCLKRAKKKGKRG